jgi:hypothetical protein
MCWLCCQQFPPPLPHTHTHKNKVKPTECMRVMVSNTALYFQGSGFDYRPENWYRDKVFVVVFSFCNQNVGTVPSAA